VKTLAELVARETGVEINYLKNPRVESSENELEVSFLIVVGVVM